MNYFPANTFIFIDYLSQGGWGRWFFPFYLPYIPICLLAPSSAAFFWGGETFAWGWESVFSVFLRKWGQRTGGSLYKAKCMYSYSGR